MVSDGNVLVLSSIGDDLDEAADLCLGIQGHTEQLCKTQQELEVIIYNQTSIN